VDQACLLRPNYYISNLNSYVDQRALTPALKINNIQFYKHPYLDIMVATNPGSAIHDLWKVWNKLIKTQEEAAIVLSITLDRCRKYSLQSFVYLESPDYLPEEHRLTSAVLSLQEVDNIYVTPTVNPNNYSSEKLFKLFGLV
jgi:hypothetical protein